jgi:hypothetical protein
MPPKPLPPPPFPFAFPPISLPFIEFVREEPTKEERAPLCDKGLPPVVVLRGEVLFLGRITLVELVAIVVVGVVVVVVVVVLEGEMGVISLFLSYSPVRLRKNLRKKRKGKKKEAVKCRKKKKKERKNLWKKKMLQKK